MSDQNKGFQKEEAPKTAQGAQSTTSTWKRLLAKKWVFPATYMAAAAIILTLMWVYQEPERKQSAKKIWALRLAAATKRQTIPKHRTGRSRSTQNRNDAVAC